MRLRQLCRNFDQLAGEDARWTVLSDPAMRGGLWDAEAFYQTGEAEIAAFEARMAAMGLRLQGDKALDFGCGVGRLTFPLSKRFTECLGIDIAPNMIAEAEANRHRGENCQFKVNQRSKLAGIDAERFDFVYSDLVFQHMPPRLAKAYFREIARCLAPGGRFAFQMPSHLDSRHERNQRPLPLLRKRLHYLSLSIGQLIAPSRIKPYFEMNAIPADRLVRYLHRRCRLRLLAAWDFPAAGPSWHSYFYLFERPIQPS